MPTYVTKTEFAAARKAIRKEIADAVKQGLLKPNLLPYTPATLSSPVEKTMAATGSTGYKPTKPWEEDVIVKSAGGRKRGMEVREWRRAQMIGVTIDLSLSGEAVNREATAAQFRKISDDIYVEGCLLNVDKLKLDVFNGGGTPLPPWVLAPNLTIQNTLFLGGITEFSDTVHSDNLEPQAGLQYLKIARCTGYTGYQGMFIAAQKPRVANYITDVNLRYFPSTGHGYQWWLLDAGKGFNKFSEGTLPQCYPIPTYLDNCWSAQDGSGRLLRQRCWPDAGQTGEIGGEMHDIGAIEGEEGGVKYVEWPPITQIYGRIWDGVPPGGDFVLAANVGDGYVSPGYRS